MSFLWPDLLWLLLILPVLAAGYLIVLGRRRKEAVSYASTSLVRAALGPRQRLRRHVPPVLLLLAITAALIALARPTAVVTLPTEQRTIILAIDVSLSMRAADIEPTRLAAAQAAAKTFVQEQPGDVRIGIVSFAGTASLVQPPTHNRSDVIAAIDGLQLQRHTAIGSGILVSLAALFPEADIDVDSLIFGPGAARNNRRGVGLDERAPKGNVDRKPPAGPVAPGSYAGGAIILLTDGRRTTGPDPLDAATMAADRGVRVYTVGFGTAQGAAVNFDGWSVFMRFDEETLKSVADITRAQYFHASSANELRKVYERLNARFVLERKETEIGALFTASAALLAVLAGLLSLVWFSRLR
jgi:Ca-activated chloride channel homolog